SNFNIKIVYYFTNNESILINLFSKWILLIGGKKRAFEVFVIKLYFKATFERDKLDKFLGASLVIKLSDPEPFTPVNLGLKPSIKSFADNYLGFFKQCTFNSFVNSFAFNFNSLDVTFSSINCTLTFSPIDEFSLL